MMTQLTNMVLANSIVIAPLAIVVTIASRWVNRPAAIHLLWLIVLVKLVFPSVVEVPWIVTPQFANHFAVSSTANETVLGAETDLAREPSANSRGYVDRSAANTEHAGGLTNLPNVFRSVDSPLLRRSVFIVWGLGSAAFFFMLVRRVRCFHQFVRRAPLASKSIQATTRSIAAKYELRETPVIRVAAGNFPPLLWVFPGSASIVLPQRFISELDGTTTKNLLAHELAHYARGDHWVRLLESIVLGIYWWHPLAWYARRQLQHAEEQCCDAWVLWAFPESKTEYARTLLSTMDYLSGTQSALPPLASGLGKTNLIRRRFEMILHHKSPREISLMGLAMSTAVAIAILPWSTAIFAQPQEAVKTAVAADARAGGQDSTISMHSTQIAQNVAENNFDAKEMHQLIRNVIHRALKGVRGELKQAKAHIAKDIRQEVARSLQDMPRGSWMRVMTKTLAELDGVSDEEIGAIAEHIESAMEHVGEAVDKSAQLFSRRLDEPDAIEMQLPNSSTNLSED